MPRSVLFTLAMSAAAVLVTRVWALPHDKVAVWAEPKPTTIAQTLAVKFKPVLTIVNGCRPYPAVDADGNTGNGLKPTGESDGRCRDETKAQVYARTGWHEGQFAIMYSWYMPKDSPSTLLGHRHDWENVVVWLDTGNDTATAQIVAMAASAHGDYKKSYPVDNEYIHEGVSAKVSYESSWPMNHELGFTTNIGTKQPLVQWEQMTDAARKALEETDFDHAHVPFKSNFPGYLEKAFYK